MISTIFDGRNALSRNSQNLNRDYMDYIFKGVLPPATPILRLKMAIYILILYVATHKRPISFKFWEINVIATSY